MPCLPHPSLLLRSTADRATFITSLARLRCDKLYNTSQDKDEQRLHECLWTVSAAIESLGAFNAETLGQIEYESVGKTCPSPLEFHSAE